MGDLQKALPRVLELEFFVRISTGRPRTNSVGEFRSRRGQIKDWHKKTSAGQSRGEW